MKNGVVLNVLVVLAAVLCAWSFINRSGDSHAGHAGTLQINLGLTPFFSLEEQQRALDDTRSATHEEMISEYSLLRSYVTGLVDEVVAAQGDDAGFVLAEDSANAAEQVGALAMGFPGEVIRTRYGVDEEGRGRLIRLEQAQHPDLWGHVLRLRALKAMLQIRRAEEGGKLGHK